jgi:Holliday junction resolvasome RuvABC ATP-dependent DNA helicase subunit
MEHQERFAYPMLTPEQALLALRPLRERYIGNTETVERLAVLVGDALTQPTKDPQKYEQWEPNTCDRCLGPGGVLLDGPPSTGKTTLARLIAEITELPYLEADGTMKNADRLFQAIQKLHQDNGLNFVEEAGTIVPAPCIVMLDEAQELDKKGAWLLKATEPKDATLLSRQGRLNTKHIFWILGTTNPERLDTALHTRFEPTFRLESYDDEEVARILEAECPELPWASRVLISRFAGRIPRVAKKIAEEAARTARWEKMTPEAAVRRLAERLGIDEDGFDPFHRRTLSYLHEAGKPVKLSRVASQAGVSDERFEKMVLPRLLTSSQNHPPLVQVSSRGITLTEVGSRLMVIRTKSEERTFDDERKNP